MTVTSNKKFVDFISNTLYVRGLKNPLFYINFVLFYHKSQLEMKLQTLYVGNAELHNLFPGCAWELRTRIAAYPYQNMIWFSSCPVLEISLLSTELDDIKAKIETQGDSASFRLETESVLYKILEFCIKAENTINFLNFWLIVLNFVLLISICLV